MTATTAAVPARDTVAGGGTELDDGLGPAIGIVLALVLSVPLWVALLVVVRSLLG